MKRLITVLGGVLLVVGFCGNLWAEDISWVTVHSRAQAEYAAQNAVSAYLRDGNRFLAGLTPEQSNALTAAGLDIVPVLRDADPATTYRVMANRKADLRAVDLQSAGSVTDLGRGIMLVTGSSAAALGDDPRYLINSLEDLSIRWLYLPPALATGLAEIQDYPTDSLANLVSLDSIYATDQRLMDFRTRYIWSDSNAVARGWIRQKFFDLGYVDVTLQPFSYGGGTHYNVVCVKPGYAEPDKVIVVGGHYDSINSQSDPMSFAPGADDNGSGTTAVLEMARVLKDVPCRKTIIFIAFSAEEQGLIGSQYAAMQFVANGTNVEVMYNYDMIGYDPSDQRQISLSGASFNSSYSDFSGYTATRVTDLIPVLVSSPGGSDHQSFMNQGFPIADAIEADFNYGGWHTNDDITSRMNFPYFTKVVKMGLAALAVVANAAHPTDIDRLTDQGDGQAIEVFWTNCDNTYTYKLFWGASSGTYTDSVDIPVGDCSHVVNGLTEGQPYYFSVVGSAPDGYPAIYAVEDSLTPLVVPRAPRALLAQPATHAIELDWADSPEADLQGYRIYRQIGELPWTLLQDNVASSSFTDTDVVGQTHYNYRITAVDFDGHESAYSLESGTWPATFDGGILVADEITQGSGVPSQDAQVAFWNMVFGDTPYGLTQIEDFNDTLSRGVAGQYSSIFWFDDDLARKSIYYSQANLTWYLSHPSNILVGGLRTVLFWGSMVVPTDDIRYVQFGQAGFTDNPEFEFIGAHGQQGWPDVVVDTDNPFYPLPYVQSLIAAPDAQVIYTYDAASDDPAKEGTPVGLIKYTTEGYRILLSFPVSYLTDSTATLLISHAKALFGETAVISSAGDVDGSGTVSVSDVTYLVAYLFLGGPAPVSMNGADPDGTCSITVSDLTYLIAYIFLNGPDPLTGCVE